MDIKKSYIIGVSIGAAIAIADLFFIGSQFFFFLLGLAVIAGVTPFMIELMRETREDVEKEEMFLEFARSLVESVKTGTPISKSIINIRNKPYGVLGPHIKKLANQISIGIPMNAALQIFSKDVDNKVISRALTLIGEAEQAGGDIGQILNAVAGAVSMSEKIKKEREAAISTLVVQGYIIFFVFLIIVIVMQFKILPILSGISGISGAGGALGIGGAGGGSLDSQELSSAFLYLLMVQGLFSGLTIGKLANGKIKSGVKHSFALMLSSFIVSSAANFIFGGA